MSEEGAPSRRTNRGTSGYIVRTQSGKKITSQLTVPTIREAALLTLSGLEGGSTKITIVEEDHEIRGRRRRAGLDPNVELEGSPGYRRVKAVTNLSHKTEASEKPL